MFEREKALEDGKQKEARGVVLTSLTELLVKLHVKKKKKGSN